MYVCLLVLVVCSKFKKQQVTPQLNNHPTLIKRLLDFSPNVFNRCSIKVNKMDISGILNLIHTCIPNSVLFVNRTDVTFYFICTTSKSNS